jgi:hypothetical protein
VDGHVQCMSAIQILPRGVVCNTRENADKSEAQTGVHDKIAKETDKSEAQTAKRLGGRRNSLASA